MTNNKKERKWIGAGLVAAVAASLCCITPVLALLGGIGGIASTFSWLEPLRPYLMIFTAGLLGYAFYKAYKPKKKEEIECACEDDEKKSFLNSKKFLWTVTIVSALLFAFPSYSGVFIPQVNNITTTVNSNISEATLQVEGMTCTSCENSVNYALKTEEGVVTASSSYKTGIAKVKYDKSKVSAEKLSKAIEEKVGYKVESYKIGNKKIEQN